MECFNFNMNWHKNFFNDPNYKNNYSFLTKERTDKEIIFLDKLFKKHNVVSVLDIPCGFGRHAIGLAKLGYVVHGVDLFEMQLAIAKKTIEEEEIKLPNLTFSQEDMRDFPHNQYDRKQYDAVINMFMSFGYYSKKEDKKILFNLCDSVAKNGLLIIEVRNPFYFLPKLIASNYKMVEVDDYGRKNITSFDPLESKLIIEFDGKKRTEMNIYYPDYYREILEEKGFKVDIDLKKHTMLIVAKKESLSLT